MACTANVTVVDEMKDHSLIRLHEVYENSHRFHMHLQRVH